MNDYFLKFADEAEAIEKLAMFFKPNGKNVWVTPYGNYSYESDKDVAFVAGNNGCTVSEVSLSHADGQWLNYKDGANLDIIGVIHKPTGVMLSGEFGDYPEMKPIDGFHVNIRAEGFDPALEQYKTYPATPSRVFA